MHRKDSKRQNWKAFTYFLQFLSKTRKVKYSNFTRDHQNPTNKLMGLPGANLTHLLSWLSRSLHSWDGNAESHLTSRRWTVYTAKPLLLHTARSRGRASKTFSKRMLADPSFLTTVPALALPSLHSTSHSTVFYYWTMNHTPVLFAYSTRWLSPSWSGWD